MKKEMTKSIGFYIIASAFIWGATIIGCAIALKGTGEYIKIQNILAGGVVSHNIIIMGPLAVAFKKLATNKTESNIES